MGKWAKKHQTSIPTADLNSDAAAVASAVSDGHTLMAAPLSDSSGREITQQELQQMLGTCSEPTIGILKDMTTIGIGGIGTVFSAHEPGLNREIAIKILRPAFRNQLNYVTGFIREARITAQIDHPNVIPVHKLGIFDDAGAYFTMKRVQGITLAGILRKLKENDQKTLQAYNRQRLLEIFISICNGVAFAHSKGIIHRDLKPANIMVGDYGEVFIADWGLAIYREENITAYNSAKIELGELPQDSSNNVSDNSGNKISGTPAFMAPEQLYGNDEDLSEQTDVYALGTILYSILTWEQTPYNGASTVTELMNDVVNRKFLRPRRRAPKRKIPYELEAITLKAMHQDKKQRYNSVIDLITDVRNYMAKYPVSAYSPLPLYRLYKLIRRRPLVPVTLLTAMLAIIIWNCFHIVNNHMEAKSLKIVVSSLLEESEKASNIAISSRRQLNDMFTRSGNTEVHGKNSAVKSRYLRSSNEFILYCNSLWEHLIHMLQLNTKRDQTALLLARLLTNQLQFADAVDSQHINDQVAGRLRQLPKDIYNEVCLQNPALAQHAARQRNKNGELIIDCPDSDVQLSAVRIHRNAFYAQTFPEEEETLIKLMPYPATNDLPNGCYLITAKHPDGRELRFPAAVNRNRSETIDLNLPEKTPPGMVYIPSGNFIFGDPTFDDQAVSIALPAFFISKYEVTIGEYLKFWKSLSSDELRERYRAYVDDITHKGRKLMPLWDNNGNLNTPYTKQMPVIGITAEAAEAYCQYMSKQTNFHYRLPTALEWEKAARGVDGREYVWGDEYRNGMACINQLDQTTPGNIPSPVGKYPADCSVYGIYDLTGNARELVTTPDKGQYHAVKGSSFNLSQRFARVAAHAYASNLSDVGFRCAVSR